jgi:hypothetical protein
MYSKMISRVFLIIILLSFIFSGCASYTLQERDRDPSKLGDAGSKTELEIKGPKADITHSF